MDPNMPPAGEPSLFNGEWEPSTPAKDHETKTIANKKKAESKKLTISNIGSGAKSL